jgi:hypothetical protein
MDPSGLVRAEIFPQIFASDPDPFDFVTGLAFQSPDHLLVGTADGSLWQIDFSGNASAGPVTFPGVTDLEGIAQTGRNRIAVAGYSAGKLMFVDGSLNRVAGRDQSYRIGFGLSQALGVAWDSDTGRHLVHVSGAFVPAGTPEVISLPRSLRSEQEVVDLTGASTPRALGYLPDDHRIAVSQTGCAPTCSILLYDHGGTLEEQGAEGSNLPVMDYIPPMQQLVARRAADASTLLFYSRTGQLVNSLDLSGLGIGITAVAFFNPGGPKRRQPVDLERGLRTPVAGGGSQRDGNPTIRLPGCARGGCHSGPGSDYHGAAGVYSEGQEPGILFAGMGKLAGCRKGLALWVASHVGDAQARGQGRRARGRREDSESTLALPPSRGRRAFDGSHRRRSSHPALSG